MSMQEWDVGFEIPLGHGLEPLCGGLTCVEDEVETVVRVLRRSGAWSLTVAKIVIPQIPEPPQRCLLCDRVVDSRGDRPNLTSAGKPVHLGCVEAVAEAAPLGQEQS
jgi:hypothetical protein